MAWGRNPGGSPDFDGRPLATEPKQYVSVKVFEKALKAAPTPGWRAMFGLCRLAGLRLEAARTLPWSGHATDSNGKQRWVGVDWGRRRLCLIGNQKTRRSDREVPIGMRLYSILHEAYQVAEDVADTITGLTPNNPDADRSRHREGRGIDALAEDASGHAIKLRERMETAWRS